MEEPGYKNPSTYLYLGMTLGGTDMSQDARGVYRARYEEYNRALWEAAHETNVDDLYQKAVERRDSAITGNEKWLRVTFCEGERPLEIQTAPANFDDNDLFFFYLYVGDSVMGTVEAAQANAGINRGQLCKQIGIGKNTLKTYEREPWRFRREPLERLAELASTTIDGIRLNAQRMLDAETVEFTPEELGLAYYQLEPRQREIITNMIMDMVHANRYREAHA